MVATDQVFAGTIPEFYDRFMVPMLFEAYAQVLAERLAKIDPQDVLETAAGTGAVTHALALRLRGGARIVATDINQPMLDRAAARGTLPANVKLQWADALALPFGDQSFDAVVCQFGVMFFPDKVKGYQEAFRVLKSGGTFLFNVWDRISENAFSDVVSKAVAGLFPNDPPDFMARQRGSRPSRWRPSPKPAAPSRRATLRLLSARARRSDLK
jgi:ubiquinone/menaquinone biosynthesis C-methylase UbiE